jgi:hypothetical protein
MGAIGLDDLEEFIPRLFEEGDRVWIRMTANLAEYINQNGGQAQVRQPTIQRVNWESVESLFDPQTAWADDYVALRNSFWGMRSSSLKGLSDVGIFAGTADEGDVLRGFLWRDVDANFSAQEDELIELGSEGGEIAIHGVTSAGVAYGSIRSGDQLPFPYVWREDGLPMRLSFPGPIGGEVLAAAPSRYVGFLQFEVQTNPQYTIEDRPFVWRDLNDNLDVDENELVVLNVPGTIWGQAQAINSREIIAGSVQLDAGNYRAFRFDGDNYSMSAGMEYVTVAGVDARGHVYGSYYEGNDTKGFVFTGGDTNVLRPLSGNLASPLSVKPDGTIVGISRDAAGARTATIWQGMEPHNLNERVLNSFGCHTGFGITAQGLIACWANTRTGQERRGQKKGRKRAENGGGNEPRPEFLLQYQDVRLAGEPGFEPGLTESESAGLPLTYSPICGRLPTRPPGEDQVPRSVGVAAPAATAPACRGRNRHRRGRGWLRRRSRSPAAAPACGSGRAQAGTLRGVA